MTPVELSIRRERRLKLFFFLASLVLILGTVLMVQNLLVSILLAIVNYYLLSPAVDFLERRGLSRIQATTLPFLALASVVGVGLYFLFPILLEQLQSLTDHLPQYLESSKKMTQAMLDYASQWTRFLGGDAWVDEQQARALAWASAQAKLLPQVLSQSLTIMILVPFFSFFMLLDGRDYVRGLLRLVPNHLFELALDLNHQIGSQIGGFIRARLIESIVVGVMIAVGLALMNFPFALVWGLLAGLLNVVPYLGPLLGALPAFLISLSGGVNSAELLLLFAIFGGAQVIDSVILVPFLVARIVNLHPVTVVLAILIGSQMMGVLGMIICIPLISALKVTVFSIYRHVTVVKNSV